MEPRSMLRMLADGREQNPSLDILTFVDVAPDGQLREEVRTYEQLWQHGLSLAEGLRAEGMGKGSSFAIIALNHPEFVEAMVASSMAGTIFVPIDWRTRGDKLRYMLSRAECEGAVVADYALPSVIEILPQLPMLKWLWVIGDVPVEVGSVRTRAIVEVLQMPVANESITFPALDAPMQMLYTSGTTGDPKAILSPHARFAAIGNLGTMMGFRSDDRPYTGLSLTHANAQLITLGNALSMGLRLVISRSFTKSRLWEIMARFGCTTFNLLGGMVIAIYAEPPGRYDRDHKVRFVLSAGMPPNLWEPFSERFGIEIFEFYGAAEGGLTLNPPGEGPIGSIGKAPANLICAILDEQDRECAPFEYGQICFRNADGSAQSVEYFGDEAASVAKTRGGWFRSGDIGYKDAEGWVFFAHRDGASIRRNGDFVNAGDVEAFIAALPGIADAYVYGVTTPDNAPGECEVVAAVVPYDPDAFDPVAMIASCAAGLSRNASPRFVQVLNEIPKTASEKPQRRFLIAGLKDGSCDTYDQTGRTKIELRGEG